MGDFKYLYARVDNDSRISVNFPLTAVYRGAMNANDFLHPYVRIRVPSNYVSSKEIDRKVYYKILKGACTNINELYPLLMFSSFDKPNIMFDKVTWEKQLKMCNYNPVAYMNNKYRLNDEILKILMTGRRYILLYGDRAGDHAVSSLDVLDIKSDSNGILIKTKSRAANISFSDTKYLWYYDEESLSTGLVEATTARLHNYVYSGIKKSIYNVSGLGPIYRINYGKEKVSVYNKKRKLVSLPNSEVFSDCGNRTLRLIHALFDQNKSGNIWVGDYYFLGDDRSKLSSVKKEYLDVWNNTALSEVNNFLYETYCPYALLKSDVDQTYVFLDRDKCNSAQPKVRGRHKQDKNSTSEEVKTKKPDIKNTNTKKKEDKAPRELTFYPNLSYRYTGNNSYLKDMFGEKAYKNGILSLCTDGESVVLNKGRDFVEVVSVVEVYDVGLKEIIGYGTLSRAFYKGVEVEETSSCVRHYCISEDRGYLVNLLRKRVGTRIYSTNWKNDLILENKYNRYGNYKWVVNTSAFVILGFNGYKAMYNKYSGKVIISGNTEKVDKADIQRSLSTPVISRMKEAFDFVYNVYDVVGGSNSLSRKYIRTYNSIDDVIDFSKGFPSLLVHVSVLGLRDKKKKVESLTIKGGKVVAVDGKKI